MNIETTTIQNLIDNYYGRSGFAIFYDGRPIKPRNLEPFESALIQASVIEKPFKHVFEVDTGNNKRKMAALVVEDGGKCQSGFVTDFAEKLKFAINIDLYPLHYVLELFKNENL